MPLKHGEVNPLAVFGMRRMEHCPPHFEPVYYNSTGNDKEILDWVWESLDGRFYFGEHYRLEENGKTSLQKVIAFEEHSEASYFCLMQSSIPQRTQYL